MKVTLCYQFDGVPLHTTACDLIEKECFNDKKLEEYASEYGADSFDYYLDQPNCDDGWVCTVAYLDFHFDNVKENTVDWDKIIAKIGDGEKVSELIEKLGYKNSYWFYDAQDE